MSLYECSLLSRTWWISSKAFPLSVCWCISWQLASSILRLINLAHNFSVKFFVFMIGNRICWFCVLEDFFFNRVFKGDSMFLPFFPLRQQTFNCLSGVYIYINKKKRNISTKGAMCMRYPLWYTFHLSPQWPLSSLAGWRQSICLLLLYLLTCVTNLLVTLTLSHDNFWHLVLMCFFTADWS